MADELDDRLRALEERLSRIEARLALASHIGVTVLVAVSVFLVRSGQHAWFVLFLLLFVVPAILVSVWTCLLRRRLRHPSRRRLHPAPKEQMTAQELREGLLRFRNGNQQ